MTVPLASLPLVPASASSGLSQARAERFERIVSDHFASMWRFLRRLGLSEADTDDAAQEVLLVVVAKLDTIRLKSERSFLFSTAFRMAARVRRGRKHEDIDEVSAESPDADPEQLLELKRARVVLDRLLAPMPLELRAVFVLYELEGMTMAEIAGALELAPGTVASRLRRGRDFFNARFGKLQAKAQSIGGTP